jgi:hypothetical protein
MGTVSRDFPLALYGIGVGSSSPLGEGEAIISPLERLREQGIIPSLTYGYNAGSLYRKAYLLHRPRYRFDFCRQPVGELDIGWLRLCSHKGRERRHKYKNTK